TDSLAVGGAAGASAAGGASVPVSVPVPVTASPLVTSASSVTVPVSVTASACAGASGAVSALSVATSTATAGASSATGSGVGVAGTSGVGVKVGTTARSSSPSSTDLSGPPPKSRLHPLRTSMTTNSRGNRLVHWPRPCGLLPLFATFSIIHTSLCLLINDARRLLCLLDRQAYPMASFRAMIPFPPDLPDAQLEPWQQAVELFHQAYRLQREGDLAGAIRAYRRSIRLYPTAEAHTFLGWVFSILHLYDEAMACCRAAIALDPTYGNAYNDLGAYLLERGQAAEAIPL